MLRLCFSLSLLLLFSNSVFAQWAGFSKPTRAPSGTALPASCVVGDLFLDTDADTNGSVYQCILADTWKDIDDDGSAGSLTFDIGDDGGNDSTALSEIATSGDTNSIFTEPSADKMLITLSNDWPKADQADTALAGDSATSFFSSGALQEAIQPYKSRFVIPSPAAGDIYYFDKALSAKTIGSINCIVDPAGSGESVAIFIGECDSNGDSCAVVDNSVITCGNTNTADDGSLSNASIDANDWIEIEVGTVTGTITQLSVVIN